MHPLYVIYDEEFESGGEICAGDENSDWPNYETVYYGFKMYGVFKNLPKCSYRSALFDSELEPGNKAYVVVVRYSDGDTFSSSSGHAHIAGVFSSLKEAEKLKKEIKDQDEELPRQYDNNPWTGYFNSLEEVRIERIEVEERMH
jgi:hypothetical protein